ncbi:MAG: hypothetical protein ABSF26_25795 [Thermoguttaceae bacterium]|jgi:hypothetical protein
MSGAKQIPEELLAKMERDRKLLEEELPELADRDVRMREAAGEDTLSGHLRQAIHHSRRPLREIGREVGISSTLLCDFLEGERTLRSDVLDRLAQAVGVTISLVAHAKE